MSSNSNGITLTNDKSTIVPQERYEILAKIGSGGYGSVFKAWDNVNRIYVAIKLISLEDNGLDIEDEINQEIAMMANVFCDQLVKYYTSFVVESNLWIVMEFLEGGSLSEVMKFGGQSLQENSIAFVMRELLKALAYLHGEMKIHRDVKGSNLLVGADGAIKLADFGVSGQLTESINKRKTRVGSPYWMAPEVITQSLYDGCADIWSTGITAIELAHGKPPYMSSIPPMRVIFLIPKNDPPTLEGDFSSEFKDFVFQCLQKDPIKRPKATELLNHPFIKKSHHSSALMKKPHFMSTLTIESNSSDGKYDSPILSSNDAGDSQDRIVTRDTTTATTSTARMILEEPNTPSAEELSNMRQYIDTQSNHQSTMDALMDGQMIKLSKSSDTNESVNMSKSLRIDGSGSDDSIGTRLTLNRSTPNDLPNSHMAYNQASSSGHNNHNNHNHSSNNTNTNTNIGNSSNNNNKIKLNLSPTFQLPTVASLSSHVVDGIATSTSQQSHHKHRVNWVKKGISTDQGSPHSTQKKPPVCLIPLDQNSPMTSSHKSVIFDSVVSPIVSSIPDVPSEFLTLVRNKVESDRLRAEAESALLESKGLQRVGSTDSGSVGGWDFTYRSNASTSQGFIHNNQYSQSKPNSVTNSASNSVIFSRSLASSYDLEHSMAITVPRKQISSVDTLTSDISVSPASVQSKLAFDLSSNERLARVDGFRNPIVINSNYNTNTNYNNHRNQIIPHKGSESSNLSVLLQESTQTINVLNPQENENKNDNGDSSNRNDNFHLTSDPKETLISSDKVRQNTTDSISTQKEYSKEFSEPEIKTIALTLTSPVFQPLPSLPHRMITPKICVQSIESNHLRTVSDVLKRNCIELTNSIAEGTDNPSFQSVSTNNNNSSSNSNNNNNNNNNNDNNNNNNNTATILNSMNPSVGNKNVTVASHKLSELFLAVCQPALRNTENYSKVQSNWQPKRSYIESIAKHILHSREERTRESSIKSLDQNTTKSTSRNSSPTPDSGLNPSNSGLHSQRYYEDTPVDTPAQDGFSKAAAPLLSSLLATGTPTQSWFSKVFGFGTVDNNDSGDTNHRNGEENLTKEMLHSKASNNIENELSDAINTELDNSLSVEEKAIQVYHRETEELVHLLSATLTALDAHTNGEITREFIIQLASYVVDEADGHV